MTAVVADRPIPRQAFKGDGEALLMELIAASEKREVTSNSPSSSPSMRTLVPYFDDKDPLAMLNEPLEQPKKGSGSRKKTPRGSPRKSRKGSKPSQDYQRKEDKFAGPAFTLSPTPESLPPPPLSLLM